MALKNIQDQEVSEILDRQFGTKATAMYFLKKANQAASRLNTHITGQNTLGIVQEAQTMMNNIDSAYRLLADDNKKLEK